MGERRHTAYRFGDKFKRVRERQGITLKTLAQQVGVSASLLSQIENNRISPSIDTLMAVADALEIDPEYLFQDVKKPRKVTVSHKSERDSMRLQDVVYHLISPAGQSQTAPQFEVVELTLEPGGKKESEEFGHPGQEIGIITQGSGELRYADLEYGLTEGDCITFASRAPHTLINSGSGSLKAIWIVSPPRMFGSGERA